MLPDEARPKSVVACCSHYQLHLNCGILLQSAFLENNENASEGYYYDVVMHENNVQCISIDFVWHTHLRVRRIRTMSWHYRATPCISMHLKYQNIKVTHIMIKEPSNKLSQGFQTIPLYYKVSNANFLVVAMKDNWVTPTSGRWLGGHWEVVPT